MTKVDSSFTVEMKKKNIIIIALGLNKKLCILEKYQLKFQFFSFVWNSLFLDVEFERCDTITLAKSRFLIIRTCNTLRDKLKRLLALYVQIVTREIFY